MKNMKKVKKVTFFYKLLEVLHAKLPIKIHGSWGVPRENDKKRKKSHFLPTF